MARTHHDTDQAATTAMPVSELHGRTVWTEGGERLGTVSDVLTDDDGRISAFDVRERWFFGAHHQVSAVGMRLEGGDVVVPNSSEADAAHSKRHRTRDVSSSSMSGATSAPVLLAGREGARSRFGGLDVLGSLVGALVAFSLVVLVGGVLGAAFGLEAGSVNFDTSIASYSDLFVEALVIGAVTLFVSCLVGGWAAGRMSRYDGVANGLMSVAWLLLLGVAFAAAGAFVGEQYDVFGSTNLPNFTSDEYATVGVIGLLGAIAIMLVGGALGGAIGEGWHRRADRAMLDVVDMGERSPDSDHDGHARDTVVMDRPVASTDRDVNVGPRHEHHTGPRHEMDSSGMGPDGGPVKPQPLVDDSPLSSQRMGEGAMPIAPKPTPMERIERDKGVDPMTR